MAKSKNGTKTVFQTKKKPLKDEYTIGCNLTFTKERADRFTILVNQLYSDLLSNIEWKLNAPTEHGTYLIQADGEFTIANISDKGIQHLNDKPLGPITRHMKLKGGK